MGEGVDHGEVMADEQRREAQSLLQLPEQLEHRRLHRHVQGAGGLVGDQQLRLQHQRPREGDPLALTARELVRVPAGVGAGQLDRLQQRAHPGRPLGRRQAHLVHDQRFGDALLDGQVRVEGGRGVLEHEADAAPHGLERLLPHAVHLVTEHLQAAAGGALEPGDGPADRGLAGARLPHQPVHLPGADGEVHALDRPERGPTEPARVLDHQVLRDHHRLGIGDLLLLLRAQRGPRRAAPQVRHRGQQLAGVLLLGAREQLLHLGALDDPAAVHHRDRIGEVGDHAHVVGDHDDRGAEAVPHLAQQVEDLGLHGDVQRGGRLVGHDQLRAQGQRHRDHDALLLAAGELVRVAVDALGGVRDAHRLQGAHRLGADLLAREPRPVRAQALPDLPPDGEDGVQGARGLLEDHRDVLAAQGAQPRPAQAHHVGAGDQHRAGGLGGLGQQPEHRAGGDGLPGAGLADDREDLPGGDLEAHPVDRVDVAAVGREVDVEVLDCQARGRVGHAATFCSGRRRLRRVRRRGSLRSLTDSPTRVTPSTASTIARPGNSPVHQIPLVASDMARFRS